MLKEMAARPQISIVAVGRLRETFWRDAESEYQRRLTAYTSRFSIAEVADEPTPENASAAQEEQVKAAEAERILAKIGVREYVVALDRKGRAFDSLGFASHLETLTAEQSVSAMTFVIGGSLGLHSSVLERADLLLSFGSFTFPHPLLRVVLLEQL
jgi:23S rRNA (pseudouridine1915-N3)-methyltransferase